MKKIKKIIKRNIEQRISPGPSHGAGGGGGGGADSNPAAGTQNGEEDEDSDGEDLVRWFGCVLRYWTPKKLPFIECL